MAFCESLTWKGIMPHSQFQQRMHILHVIMQLYLRNIVRARMQLYWIFAQMWLVLCGEHRQVEWSTIKYPNLFIVNISILGTKPVKLSELEQLIKSSSSPAFMIGNITIDQSIGDLMKSLQNFITTNQDLACQGQDAGLQFLKETNAHRHPCLY